MLLELLDGKLLEKVFGYTDIVSLDNLAVCSRAYSTLCRPYLWKHLKILLINTDSWDDTKDLYMEDHELEHLMNTVGGYFQHTESLQLTDDSYRVAYLNGEVRLTPETPGGKYF